MASKTYRRKSFDHFGNQYTSESLDLVTFNSSRKPGSRELLLQPQSFALLKQDARVITQLWKPDGAPYLVVDALTSWPDFVTPAMEQQARARAYSRMKGNTASLAMTIATIGQTRDMIQSKATGMTMKTDRMIKRLDLERRRGHLVKKNTGLADAWLEYFYGWKPFISDIADGLETVSTVTPAAAWVSGRATGVINQRTEGGNSPRVTITYTGQSMACYSIRCNVSNPNAWLANRMGLINPGTVAWDLVPWSFVVNMFVNANALIGSVTDEVGLSVSGQNLTRTVRGTRTTTHRSSDFKTITTTQNSYVNKSRTLGALPISVVFQRPKLNWDLAVTASALLFQKVNKLNALADKLYRPQAYTGR